MLPISWDYRLDPPPAPAPDDREEYEAFLDAHSDITWRGSLDSTDRFIAMHESEWIDLYGSDLAEPDGFDQDWRNL